MNSFVAYKPPADLVVRWKRLADSLRPVENMVKLVAHLRREHSLKPPKVSTVFRSVSSKKPNGRTKRLRASRDSKSKPISKASKNKAKQPSKPRARTAILRALD